MSTRNRVWKWNAKENKVMEVLPEALPEVNAPYVEDDTIPATVSHATDEGVVFTSRSKLYAHYKEHGFECTGGSHLTGKSFVEGSGKKFESGEERTRKASWGMLKVDPEIRASVAESLRKLKWGMAPTNEREKEQCRKEQSQYQEYAKNQRT